MCKTLRHQCSIYSNHKKSFVDKLKNIYLALMQAFNIGTRIAKQSFTSSSDTIIILIFIIIIIIIIIIMMIIILIFIQFNYKW